MKEQPPTPPVTEPFDPSDVDEMIALARELKDTFDPEDREGLLIQLAERGLANHDFSETDLCEDCHNTFEEYYLIQQKFRMVALRVGRLMLEMMPDESEPEDGPKLN